MESGDFEVKQQVPAPEAADFQAAKPPLEDVDLRKVITASAPAVQPPPLPISTSNETAKKEPTKEPVINIYGFYLCSSTLSKFQKN